MRLRPALLLLVLFALFAPDVGSARAEVGVPPGGAPIAFEDTGGVPLRGDAPVVLEDGAQLWMVTLSKPPTADGGSGPEVLGEQVAFRTALVATGIRVRERRSSHTLWNGLTLAIQPGDVARLLAMPGVLAVHPAVPIRLPEEPPTLDPSLLTALAMTGADIAHTDLGLTGAGVRVGIIDTGIDYDHPDLGGDGIARRNSAVFPTARVVAGYDLVGDTFNSSSAPAPDALPDDCTGHGTHVAGIIGARGGVTGVAPGVVFGAYRVFGCASFSTPDIVIAALERALDDRMQVVNLSLGLPLQWPSHPLAEACDRLVKRGVVVVASIGNLGAFGLYAGGSPAVGRGVIGVAGFDNTHVHAAAELRASPDGAAFAYLPGLGAPLAPLAGTYPLARTGTSTSTADGCAPPPPGSLAGKVALIRRGGCNVYTKVRNAEAAGAIAVVVYSDVILDSTPDARGTPAVTIPVVGISAAAGETLDGRLDAGTVEVTWSVASVPNPATGGAISPTSTWGPSPDLSLKPDLGAPGGYIFSTYALERGGYTSMSGTSMASPHVAGAAALLLETRPRSSPDDVRTALMNTASPRLRPGTPIGLDAVHRQGAGMIDIPGAILATTRVEPASLALGESEGGPRRHKLTIENRGPAAVSYQLSHAPALATGPDIFSAAVLVGDATAFFSAAAVRVPRGGKHKVEVTIAPDPALPTGTLFGGYVVLTPSDGGREIRVPYFGYAGDYQDLPALTPTSDGFPWLARFVNGFLVHEPGGATFTLDGNDLPYILLHLDRPVSELEMEVFDAVTGRTWHRMFFARDYPRSMGAEGLNAFPWNGRTQHGKKVIDVPNGRYVVTLTVLKPLGDRRQPDHVETWTSPVITLARPAQPSRLVADQEPGEVVDASAAPIESTAGSRALWLAPGWPNPFGASVALRFVLPAAGGPVSLQIYDPLGRRLRTWRWSGLPAGEHSLEWDGRGDDGHGVGPGLLLMRLETPSGALTRKLVRVR